MRIHRGTIVAAILALTLDSGTPGLAQSPSDWKPLFDGKSLEGWDHVGPGRFAIEDGQLRTEGGMGLLYYSREKLGDCTIRVVYKLGTPRSNSGLYVRIADRPADPWYAVHHGFEVQIADGGQSARGTGSVYTFADARARPAKPGEWNTLEVTLRGNRVATAINGTQVADFDASGLKPEAAEKTGEGDPARGPRPESGYIGLQNHDKDSTVFFKEVSVRPLPATPADPSSEAFTAGEPLKLSKNARTIGGFRFAESVSYDAERDLFVAVNAGMPQDVVPNDGYVGLINPDGSVHTLKWIGVNRKGLTLNHPLGSDIMKGMLYVADIDTVRRFDMATGRPIGSVKVEGVTRFNDVEVAEDGTIYATQTGTEQDNASWRLYKITPDGKSSILVGGAPLKQPNGVAFDPKGNIVVVNIGSKDILTFSPSGELLRTEESIDAGNDGLSILPDGTKYVSSVRIGTVARIRPGQKAELIASGIPSAASMCYDPKRNRLVIPMNDWNAITFVELGSREESR